MHQNGRPKIIKNLKFTELYRLWRHRLGLAAYLFGFDLSEAAEDGLLWDAWRIESERDMAEGHYHGTRGVMPMSVHEIRDVVVPKNRDCSGYTKLQRVSTKSENR